jgi:ABC-type nitrate/sulfonate/bicarbonate transport system permease component
MRIVRKDITRKNCKYMKTFDILWKFIIATIIASVGTIVILFSALWLRDDPILRVRKPADREFAIEEVRKVFSNDAHPNLMSATQTSLKRVAYVVIISTVVGSLGGFMLCRGRRRWGVTQPFLDFLRSTPATLWIGVAGAFFASGKNFMSVTLATIPCSLIMLYEVRHALAQESQEHRHSFRLLSRNQSSVRLFLLFTFPKALPAVLTGLRIIVSYALVLVVVLEMCGASGDAQGLGDIATKHNSIGWSSVGVAWFVGCVGFVLNRGIDAAEKYLTTKIGFSPL